MANEKDKAKDNPAGEAVESGRDQLHEKKEELSRTLKKTEQEMNERASELKDEVMTGDRAREVVGEYPALTVIAAAGLGILVGRILVSALAPRRPKTFSEKVEMRARELARYAQGYAREAGDYARKTGGTVSKQAHRTARDVEDRMVGASKVARKRIEQAGDYSEILGEAIRAALITAVTTKVNDWARQLTSKR